MTMNELEALRGKKVRVYKNKGATIFRVDGKLTKLIGYSRGWSLDGGEHAWIEFSEKDVDKIEGGVIFLK